MSFVFRLLLLFGMMFCHIFDDYYLQGILAKMKQWSWWIPPNCTRPQRMYQKDYKMALLEHAFSWSFVMTLPLLIVAIVTRNVYLSWVVSGSYICNTISHSYVDNLKANKKKINLVEDQSLHFLQVFLTWIIAMGAI